MTGFVCPEECDTPEKRAEHLMARLEALLTLTLPWEKVGIAHLNCSLMFKRGDMIVTLRAVPEELFRAAMRRLARGSSSTSRASPGTSGVQFVYDDWPGKTENRAKRR